MGTNIRQNVDGSASFVDDTLGEVARVGGSSASAAYRSPITVKVALAITSGGGGAFAWTPPVSNQAVIVTSVVADITTGVAQTISIGVAANATTSSANLIDTLTMTTGVYDNITNKGAGGLPTRKVAVGQYVTGTNSATATGLVGNVYITYLPV